MGGVVSFSQEVLRQCSRFCELNEEAVHRGGARQIELRPHVAERTMGAVQRVHKELVVERDGTRCAGIGRHLALIRQIEHLDDIRARTQDARAHA